MDLGLDKKIIIVTGGSKGIGSGIVSILAEEGAIPIIIGRNQNSILKSVSNYRKKGFPDRLHYKIATLCNERGIKIDGKIFGELSKNLQAVDTRPLEILSEISIKVSENLTEDDFE